MQWWRPEVTFWWLSGGTLGRTTRLDCTGPERTAKRRLSQATCRFASCQGSGQTILFWEKRGILIPKGRARTNRLRKTGELTTRCVPSTNREILVPGVRKTHRMHGKTGRNLLRSLRSENRKSARNATDLPAAARRGLQARQLWESGSERLVRRHIAAAGPGP